MTADNNNAEQGSTESRVDLDTILVEEVGQFGCFQIRSLILGMIVTIFASWGANEFIFTTARIPTR